MPNVADLEHGALCPPEHDDTELLICEECDCYMDEYDFCKHCEEVAECSSPECISNKLKEI